MSNDKKSKKRVKDFTVKPTPSNPSNPSNFSTKPIYDDEKPKNSESTQSTANRFHSTRPYF